MQWVSLEDLALHAVDEPELMEEVTAELKRISLDVFESIRRACQQLPIRFVNVPDNITAPTIGPTNFRKYCVPLYQRLSEMLQEKDVKVFVHMDGDLKPLWDQIGESGVRGLKLVFAATGQRYHRGAGAGDVAPNAPVHELPLIRSPRRTAGHLRPDH